MTQTSGRYAVIYGPYEQKSIRERLEAFFLDTSEKSPPGNNSSRYPRILLLVMSPRTGIKGCRNCELIMATPFFLAETAVISRAKST